MKIKLVFLILFFFSAGYSQESQDLLKSIVIIQNRLGSGTGVLAIHRGIKVIITNAHVVMGSELKCVSQDGKDILYESVFMPVNGSDIALLKLNQDNPMLSTMAFLDIDKNSGKYNINDTIIIYGNNQGQSVITQEQGKIVGIGPDKIEFDAPVVPGSSGGPLIHEKTGNVIGLVSYATKRKEDWNNSDTRYKNIRRFAVRTDRIGTLQEADVDKKFYSTAISDIENLEKVYKYLYELEADMIRSGRKSTIPVEDLSNAISKYNKLSSYLVSLDSKFASYKPPRLPKQFIQAYSNIKNTEFEKRLAELIDMATDLRAQKLKNPVRNNGGVKFISN